MDRQTAGLGQDPDANGFFGRYGGMFLPPQLEEPFAEIIEAYHRIANDATFINELRMIRKTFQGRPTPVYHARNLSLKNGGAQIYLKREDLNHTGAHKLNHCMGEVDIAKQQPNVLRMRLLGAKVVPVTFGLRTLKEAVDSAFEAYLADPKNAIYCIGSVVGPHPFPLMVRDFQKVVGIEAREQFLEMTGNLPDAICACVGVGSNAMGLFSGFLNDPTVGIYGVEPLGRGPGVGDNAATMSYGREGVIHGFRCYLLQNEDGSPAPVYSCASGLDYPGVGPEHCYLKDAGRVSYVSCTDGECRDAFFQLCRLEGIIPALESAHAVAFALKKAREVGRGTILVNLSGRGDKDMDYVIENWGIGEA